MRGDASLTINSPTRAPAKKTGDQVHERNETENFFRRSANLLTNRGVPVCARAGGRRGRLRPLVAVGSPRPTVASERQARSALKLILGDNADLLESDQEHERGGGGNDETRKLTDPPLERRARSNNKRAWERSVKRIPEVSRRSVSSSIPRK